jgi:hypothetical protein
LSKLRKKYTEAIMDSDKDRIWQKALKIAPWLTKKDFLARIKKVKKEDSEAEEK